MTLRGRDLLGRGLEPLQLRLEVFHTGGQFLILTLQLVVVRLQLSLGLPQLL